MSGLPHVPLGSRLCRPATAAGITLALAGGAIAASAPAAQAVPRMHAPHGSTGAATSSPDAGHGYVWARTVTGREVRVSRHTFIATPIHPEKITHPGRDFAGSTLATHFHGRVISQRPAISLSSVPQLPGIDVSSHQGSIKWRTVCPNIDFVYAKATEGTYYTNPDFKNQYNGPHNCGLIRGAYHFANPADSSGRKQANFFVNHGGGWSPHGKTLPGALDIEYNPYGQECYNLTHKQMVKWIKSFVNQYAVRERVFPTIYSTTDWWTTCTGNHSKYFGSRDPLWIARHGPTVGTLPHGWRTYTFWQHSGSPARHRPGDQDVFNGAKARLKVLAKKG